MDGTVDPAPRTARLAGLLALAGSLAFLAGGFLPLLRLDGIGIELAGLDPGTGLGDALGAWITSGAHVWGAALAVAITGVTLLSSPWSGGLRAGILLAIGLLWLALIGHLVFQPVAGARVGIGAGVALLGIALTLAAGTALLSPRPAEHRTGWIVRLLFAAGIIGGAVLAWAAVGGGSARGEGTLAVWGFRTLAALPFFLAAASVIAARVHRHPRYTISLGASVLACGLTLLVADVTGRRPGPFLFAALAAVAATTAVLVLVTIGATMRRPTPATVAALFGIGGLAAASLLPLTTTAGQARDALVTTGSLGEALTGMPLPSMLVGLAAAGALLLLMSARKRLAAGLLAGSAIFAVALFATLGWHGSPRAGALYGLAASVLLLLASFTGLGEPEAVRPIPEAGLEPSPT